MKGARWKKDGDGCGYESPALPGMNGDYDHFTGELTKKRHNAGSGRSGSGGGSYDFSGITGIGGGYDSFTGIRPADNRRRKD